MDFPEKPDESDCCNSGCNPCIFDVYESYLKKSRNLPIENKKEGDNCISPLFYSVFKLINILKVSQDTFLYTFEYIRPFNNAINFGTDLTYEPGQHFLLKGKFNNEEFTRAYTPIPMENKKLQFTTLIKLYKYGKMSKYLKCLEIGSETLWRGPYGDYNVNYQFKNILLLAQGTGIAPIYSIICDIINNETCYAFVKLFFCCRNCDNIYLREKLYNLSSNWNFTYEIFLSNFHNKNVKYNEVIHDKKLTLNDIRYYLYDKQDVQILICGSEHFIDEIKQYVLTCKVTNENVYSF